MIITNEHSDRATGMEKIAMVTSKRVGGEVEYNDGEFAEVQTFGIEGIETDLLLETIQIHREDTEDTPEGFQSRFPIGMCHHLDDHQNRSGCELLAAELQRCKCEGSR